MEIVRPCFLVIDREYSGSISTRKLVIETAKFNVLTAYSAAEGIMTLERFPAMDGIVVNADTEDMECNELIASLRQIVPTVQIVVVGRSWSSNCGGADYAVETFEPDKLLAALRKMRPREAEAIEKHDEQLHDQQ